MKRLIRLLNSLMWLQISLTFVWMGMGVASAQTPPKSSYIFEDFPLVGVSLVPEPFNFNRSYVVAKVVRVKPNPVAGGYLEVVEQLSGSPVPKMIEVDNSQFVEAGGKDGEMTSRLHFPTQNCPGIKVGQFWLVWYEAEGKEYDDQGRVFDKRIAASVLLRGMKDNILVLVRRHKAWLARKDKRAFTEAERILLNKNEPSPSRLAALCSLRAMTNAGYSRFTESPNYPLFQKMLKDYLTQPALPPKLYRYSLRFFSVNPIRELAVGSDEDVILRFLMDMLQKETSITSDIGDCLSHIARQSVGNTIYHYPEIVTALEQREKQDTSKFPNSPGEHHVTRILIDLQKQMRNDLASKTDRVILRKLPPQ